MRKREIDTPALILDLDVMEENLAAMAAFFRDRPQKLRPHFKTPDLVRRLASCNSLWLAWQHNNERA